MQINDKILWVIAGPNGSGKTTLVQRYKRNTHTTPFINPDDIAKRINPLYDGKDLSLIIKAGKEAITLQNQFLEEGKSFGFETTFSGKRDILFLQKAKSKNYNIKIVFINLNSPGLNFKRVKQRFNSGGHDVSPKDIFRRYKRSMQNLKGGMALADSVYIFDNSKSKIDFICKLKNNKIVKVTNEKTPSWVKEIPALKYKMERAKKINATSNQLKR